MIPNLWISDIVHLIWCGRFPWIFRSVLFTIFPFSFLSTSFSYVFFSIYSVLVGAICILSGGGKMRTLGLGCVIGDGTGVISLIHASSVLLRPLDMLSVMLHLLIQKSPVGEIWRRTGSSSRV
ncbi:hypothetical protein VTN49DRAFT_6236 [Thermomyces lanuginosus]|uniref:uncharacterized protein n=1 Tax=Thermomyces lanuginosus TaxID=5541 RepID=UPI003743300B